LSLWDVFESSPWAFPILTGLISSILALPLLNTANNLFGVGKKRRELRERVAHANAEVVAALRPSVAAGIVPEEGTIWSLLRSSARRRQLALAQLLTPPEVADELIREVMESPFLTGEAKVQLATRISELRPEDSTTRQANINPTTPKSSILRLIAIAGTGVATTYLANQAGISVSWGGVLLVVLIVAGVIILSAIVFVLVSNLGGQAQEIGPAISFVKDAQARTLTVVQTEESDWSDYAITGAAGLPAGPISAGDTISGCSGSVSIAHKPTGTVVYTTEF
jgi:hypothetical protein